MLISYIQAGLRRFRTLLYLIRCRHFLSAKEGLHIGKGCSFWAPVKIEIGKNVYIGKNVNMETNCKIGDGCLIANHVAMVGRHDHDFLTIGVPVRFAPWIGGEIFDQVVRQQGVFIGDDVWVGYGVIILSGVK